MRIKKHSLFKRISLPRYKLRKDVTAVEMPKAARLPEGFSEKDIKIESSTCTGEKTIGFFDRSDNRLKFAELVESDSDVAAFYKRYGLIYKGDLK